MDNPYESPTANLDVNVKPESKMQIASQGKRFVNLIVDNIIIQVLSAMAGFVLGIVFVATRVASDGTLSQADQTSLQIISFILGLFTAVGYFVVTEALFQRTLAKFLTGTIVVSQNGDRASFGQIIGRSFARLIPFEAFSFLGGKQPVGWHDSLSGTRVIEAK